MNRKKIIALVSIVMIIMGSLLFLYSNSDRTIGPQNTSKDIVLEGHLVKDNEEINLLGWVLLGDLEYEKYEDKKVKVTGVPTDQDYQLKIKNIEITDEDKDLGEIHEIIGSLEYISGEKTNDVHYRINNYEIRTDKDFSEYVGQKVFVKAIESKFGPQEQEDITVDAKEISKIIEISGVLEGEKVKRVNKEIHYNLGEYDIHSTENLSDYIDKEVKIEVYIGQHGFINSEKEVSFIKIIE
ncbi:hypothetical protein [Alkaliphilus sp. B6464]|uniref:hypothetical protein n=1 Tax=Alkaliphilus sp. B6464 TaxID=2731219 RepID=UPI001BABEA99|nr:hypothetical protein [Alkaliphilus sp. B6464]QUH22169.1 hypothetical protein HYG84_19875 [Alkaliphilus sp. B6464]